MNTITLELPETLHRQLEALARGEGISLQQYLLYALTRQASTAFRVQAVSAEEQQQECQRFAELLDTLGTASSAEIDRGLAERESVASEPELSADIAARLQQRIANQSSSN